MQRSAPKRVDLRHDRHPFACVGRPLPPSGRARAPGPLTVRWRDDTPPTPKGQRIALLFALAAERLNLYYAHGQWLTEAQGASLAADWLGRTKSRLPLAERRLLSSLSDQFARQVAASLSREAGLYTAHEMMEALDPNTHSELAQTLLAECAQLIDDQFDPEP